MSVAMILEGAGYAFECINLTQFIYEEGYQTSNMASGVFLLQKNYNTALNCIEGPMNSCMGGLWNFGMIYGFTFPMTWMAFVYFWYAAKKNWVSIHSLMERYKQLDQIETGNEDQTDNTQRFKQKLDECSSKFNDYDKVMACMMEDPFIKYFFQKFKDTKSLHEYNQFVIEFERALQSPDMEYKHTVMNRLDAGLKKVANGYFKIDKWKRQNKKLRGPTKKELNNFVKEIWSNLNYLQKDAYKRLPGGQSYAGYSVLYNRLFNPPFKLRDGYIPPKFGIKVYGIGPVTDFKSVTIEDNKKSYKISNEPVVPLDFNFTVKEGSINPAAIIDSQRGIVIFLRKIEGKVEATYTYGQTQTYLEPLCTNPERFDAYQLQNFPIRWRTAYLKVDGKYIECIAINTQMGLLEVRTPDVFLGGSTFHFRTYTPCIGLKYTVKTADNSLTTFEDVTDDYGFIRIGQTVEDGPRNVTEQHTAYGTRTRENVTVEDVVLDEYIDVLGLI